MADTILISMDPTKKDDNTGQSCLITILRLSISENFPIILVNDTPDQSISGRTSFIPIIFAPIQTLKVEMGTMVHGLFTLTPITATSLFNRKSNASNKAPI